MIPTEDYSYIGSGSLQVREYGAAAPFLPIGNCSDVKFTPQEDVKQLPDYTQPGGGQRNDVRRVSGVGFTFTFHDFSAENFALGLRADVTSIASGTATDEPIVAYLGGYTPLEKIAATITSVKSPDGITTYDVDDDYELRDGVLYVPAGSSIPAPVAGAANIEVTYTYGKQKKVEALVNPNKKYEVMFVGLNEAQSGKKVRIRAHKVSAGVLAEMALIGDDFGGGTIAGSLMSDGAKVGQGISKYFVVDQEA